MMLEYRKEFDRLIRVVSGFNDKDITECNEELDKKLKQLLQYEMFFYAVIMIVASFFAIYIGWDEKIGIDKLKIYGCPNSEFNPMVTCDEEDKIVVGLKVDYEYNFAPSVNGTVYDPYGHYARKKKIINYVTIFIIMFGLLAVFKVYYAIKNSPKIMEYFRKRKGEHE